MREKRNSVVKKNVGGHCKESLDRPHVLGLLLLPGWEERKGKVKRKEQKEQERADLEKKRSRRRRRRREKPP